jgi:hypothetical protein
MKRIRRQYNQNVIDIVLQETGSVNRVIDFLNLNEEPYNNIIYRDNLKTFDITDNLIVNYYRKRNFYVVTGEDPVLYELGDYNLDYMDDYFNENVSSEPETSTTYYSGETWESSGFEIYVPPEPVDNWTGAELLNSEIGVDYSLTPSGNYQLRKGVGNPPQPYSILFNLTNKYYYNDNLNYTDLDGFWLLPVNNLSDNYYTENRPLQFRITHPRFVEDLDIDDSIIAKNSTHKLDLVWNFSQLAYDGATLKPHKVYIKLIYDDSTNEIIEIDYDGATDQEKKEMFYYQEWGRLEFYNESGWDEENWLGLLKRTTMFIERNKNVDIVEIYPISFGINATNTNLQIYDCKIQKIN